MRGVTTVGKLYSDTCGYCVEMAPAWEQMENNINGKQTKSKNVIKFHNIEASNLSDGLPMLNKTLVGQKIAEPNAFPTVYKHENGKVSYYQGAREVEPMTKWVMGSPNKNKTKRRQQRGRRTRGKR